VELKKGMESGHRRASLMAEFNNGLSMLYDIKTKKIESVKFIPSLKTSKSVDKYDTIHKPRKEKFCKILYERLKSFRTSCNFWTMIDRMGQKKFIYNRI
jgi:hypothetical protein